MLLTTIERRGKGGDTHSMTIFFELVISMGKQLPFIEMLIR
jgi:hypothetical protein